MPSWKPLTGFKVSSGLLWIKWCPYNTKDKHLEIKFSDKNQVVDKIVWGLSGCFQTNHLSYVC